MFTVIGNKTTLNRRMYLPLKKESPDKSSIAFDNGNKYLLAAKPAITVARSPVGVGWGNKSRK